MASHTASHTVPAVTACQLWIAVTVAVVMAAATVVLSVALARAGALWPAVTVLFGGIPGETLVLVWRWMDS